MVKKKRVNSKSLVQRRKLASSDGAGRQQSSWTFLTNHSHVLICIAHNPSILMREVAHDVGITERAAIRILQDLESEGYVKKFRIGRCNTYSVVPRKKLRHPIEDHKTIEAIIALGED